MQSYSTSPSVRSSTKVSVSPASDIYTITSRFGSHRVRVLIIISRHLFFGHCRMFCGQINEKRASQPRSKQNTNWCITKYIFCMLDISINLFGIQYLPTHDLHKGFWRTFKERSRTERTRKVQLQSSHFGRAKFIFCMFSCSHN